MNSGFQQGAGEGDIEIGCGGTILKMMQQGVRPTVHWVVFSSNDVRAAEAEGAADRFLIGAAKKQSKSKGSVNRTSLSRAVRSRSISISSRPELLQILSLLIASMIIIRITEPFGS